jgi:hypothetical protein
MATQLNDSDFLNEVDLLIRGKPNELVKTEEAAAPAPAPAPTEPAPSPAPAEAPAPSPAPAEPAPSPAPAAGGDDVTEPPAKTAAELAAEHLQGQQPAPSPAPAAGPAPAPAASKTAEQIAAELENGVAQPIDYKTEFGKIVGATIRAGGKDITIANVEEAISLIQKGVGFNTKMNKVQKDVAIAQALRNAGIDQSTLNLLIDAHQKKPGAIKKLLDSAKLDPLTFDSAEASTYAPSDHSVEEAQIQFQTVVDDLATSEHGQAILKDANGWDQGSKAEIYKTPDMLTLLTHQKESGLYDRIKTQIDRGKMVGSIPMNESFLVSYTRVGQQMMQAAQPAPSPAPAPTPTPVAQKVLTPTPPANAQRAAAAAPTKTTSGPASKPAVPNTKGMNDEEFMKSFRSTIKI